MMLIGTMDAATASACRLVLSSGVGSRGGGCTSRSTEAEPKTSQQEVRWSGLRTSGVRGRVLFQINSSSVD